MAETSLPKAYSSKLLDHIEEYGIGRKVVSSDGVTRWYLPGVLSK